MIGSDGLVEFGRWMVDFFRQTWHSDSNKSELRLRIEEFDDGGEVRQILAYAEQDRGLLESECIESCALEYI